MVKLNVLFVLLLLIVLMVGEFNLWNVAVLCLFPTAAIILYLVSKWMTAKEASYQPLKKENWSFFYLQRTYLNKKLLFKGEENRGSIQQYFKQKWQYVVSDFFDLRLYLSLRIYIGDDCFDVRWERRKGFSQQEHWVIYKNDVVIGKAYTALNVKNMSKLKEEIIFELGEAIWATSARTVTSTVSLMTNNKQEGELRRNHLVSNVHSINVTGDRPEYIVSLILHFFYFK